METVYDELTNHLCWIYSTLEGKNERFVIGISGSPGSGKSTSSIILKDRVNAKIGKEVCVYVPLDGYHLYKKELDEMEDVEEAYKRRGSPYTFNSKKFYEMVVKLKNGMDIVKVPSFDHKVGDPIEDDIIVEGKHRIVLVEGNYVFMKREKYVPALHDKVKEDFTYWEKTGNLFNEKWFIDCDLDVAMERVRKRHLGTGLSSEGAIQRVAYNDKPNGELAIACSKNEADRVISSKNDSKYES